MKEKTFIDKIQMYTNEKNNSQRKGNLMDNNNSNNSNNRNLLNDSKRTLDKDKKKKKKGAIKKIIRAYAIKTLIIIIAVLLVIIFLTSAWWVIKNGVYNKTKTIARKISDTHLGDSDDAETLISIDDENRRIQINRDAVDKVITDYCDSKSISKKDLGLEDDSTTAIRFIKSEVETMMPDVRTRDQLGTPYNVSNDEYAQGKILLYRKNVNGNQYLEYMPYPDFARILARFGEKLESQHSLGAVSEGMTSENAEQLWEYLKQRGWNDLAVAAVLGNMFAESGYLSNNLQNSSEASGGYTDESYTEGVNSGAIDANQFATEFDGSAGEGGYGLCQWTAASRKLNLYNFAKETDRTIDDYKMQLDFLEKELIETIGMPNFKDGVSVDGHEFESIDEATDEFFQIFEYGDVTKSVSEDKKVNFAYYEKRLPCAQANFDEFADKYADTPVDTSLITFGTGGSDGGQTAELVSKEEGKKLSNKYVTEDEINTANISKYDVDLSGIEQEFNTKEDVESNYYNLLQSYFTVDEERNVIIATLKYKQVDVSYTDEQGGTVGEDEIPEEQKTEPSYEATVKSRKINVRQLVREYAMPFELQMALLMITANPSAVRAFSELAEDYKAVIEIQDNETSKTTTETSQFIITRNEASNSNTQTQTTQTQTTKTNNQNYYRTAKVTSRAARTLSPGEKNYMMRFGNGAAGYFVVDSNNKIVEVYTDQENPDWTVKNLKRYEGRYVNLDTSTGTLRSYATLEDYQAGNQLQEITASISEADVPENYYPITQYDVNVTKTVTTNEYSSGTSTKLVFVRSWLKTKYDEYSYTFEETETEKTKEENGVTKTIKTTRQKCVNTNNESEDLHPEKVLSLIAIDKELGEFNLADILKNKEIIKYGENEKNQTVMDSLSSGWTALIELLSNDSETEKYAEQLNILRDIYKGKEQAERVVDYDYVDGYLVEYNSGKWEPGDSLEPPKLTGGLSNEGSTFFKLAKYLHDYMYKNRYFYSYEENVKAGKKVIDGGGTLYPHTKFPVINEKPEDRYSDCSLYVSWVIAWYNEGDVPKDNSGMMSTIELIQNAMNYKEVSFDDLEKGDILVYDHGGGANGHTAIYAGKDENGNPLVIGSGSNEIYEEYTNASGYFDRFQKAFRPKEKKSIDEITYKGKKILTENNADDPTQTKEDTKDKDNKDNKNNKN